jgi:hypothetical protein
MISMALEFPPNHANGDIWYDHSFGERERNVHHPTTTPKALVVKNAV